MNNKLVKASIAGAAAMALAAGGTTFAAWSDWDTLTGSRAGADVLSLELNEPNAHEFDNLKLAPGEGADYEFVVVNRTGTTVKKADLRMVMANLQGKEDGCTSTNSELAVDGDCNDTATDGEFDDQAVFGVNVSQPTTDIANACSLARGSRQTATPLRTFFNANNPGSGNSLGLLSDGVTLAPGQGICVGMGLSMPAGASNASQGDSASFDLTFLLNQVVS